MNRKIGTALLLGFGLNCVSPVFAQAPDSPEDGFQAVTMRRMGNAQVFAGVRLWANEWDMLFFNARSPAADPANPGGLVLRDEVGTSLSDMRVVPMPTLGVRYGNFLGALTYFVPTSYESDGLRRSVERRELDVSLGYYVLPSVLVSLGYKKGEFSRFSDDVDSDLETWAVLLGVTGSAPLTDRLSLYGTLAYGPGRQETDVSDAGGDDSHSVTYTVAELGLSYRFIEGGSRAFVRSVSASLGYRIQNYTAKDVELGTYAVADPATPIATESRDFRATTAGPVLAVVVAF